MATFEVPLPRNRSRSYFRPFPVPVGLSPQPGARLAPYIGRAPIRYMGSDTSSHARIKSYQADFANYDIKNQYFHGPDGAGCAYASVCVLDPIIKIEHYNEEYHIAVRFNLETTILGYDTQKSNDHEWFFSDVCLQYLSQSNYEKLVMEPVSEKTAAFEVTRSSNTTASGTVGLTAGQIPSANVSLGLTRSRDLTVQYSVNTWSVTSHRVAAETPMARSRSIIAQLRNKVKFKTPENTTGEKTLEESRYQWFWVGNQEDTEILTTDLKHSVTRHVTVKRIIPDSKFPITRSVEISLPDLTSETENNPETIVKTPSNSQSKVDKAVNEAANDKSTKPKLPDSLGDILAFKFCVKVRVKSRHGRLHRLLEFSSNKVKGSLLKPDFVQKFELHVDLASAPDVKIPTPDEDTPEITNLLEKVKAKYTGAWDDLKGKDIRTIQSLISDSDIALEREEEEREREEEAREREAEAQEQRELDAFDLAEAKEEMRRRNRDRMYEDFPESNTFREVQLRY